jgi:hypothetical protein
VETTDQWNPCGDPRDKLDCVSGKSSNMNHLEQHTTLSRPRDASKYIGTALQLVWHPKYGGPRRHDHGEHQREVAAGIDAPSLKSGPVSNWPFLTD